MLNELVEEIVLQWTVSSIQRGRRNGQPLMLSSVPHLCLTVMLCMYRLEFGGYYIIHAVLNSADISCY